jgi:hypothetical protein
MRSRHPLLVLVLVLGLVAMACGDDDQPDETDPQAQDELEQPADERLEEPVDLPDGVAATVNGTEIEESIVDERVEGRLDALAESDIEGAQDIDPDEARTPLAAQVLTFMISHRVIMDAGEEAGVELTQDDLEAARESAADETGGEDELDAAIDQQGITDEEFQELLELQATLEALREELDLEEPAGPQPDDETAQPQPDPLEGWLMERFNEADVEVDEDYGHWDPMSGQVVPAGAMDGMSPAPEEGP